MAVATIAAAPVSASAVGTSAVATSSTVPSGDFVVTAQGDTLWLVPPVEVLGSRVPVALPGTVRDVSVRGADELARLPGWSAAEPLAQVPGVEVRQRLPYGAQADLSIRGSTFEQVQLLLDGSAVGDPQTGHHTMDLPLGVDDIGQLEVLRGHGSALYGANAFGGTVNIVPRAPALALGGQVTVTGGEAGLWGVRASADVPIASSGGDVMTRVSAARLRTDGDRPDSDAESWTATARAVAESDEGASATDLFLGYARREFGAQDFYAPYPSWERTETAYGALKLRRRLSSRLVLEQRLRARRHEDHYVLLRGDPDLYSNDHTTHIFGGEGRGVLDLPGGLALASAVDVSYEDIRSVGTRRAPGGTVARGVPLAGDGREHIGWALELARLRSPLRWAAGGRLDARTKFAPRLSGSAAMAWEVARWGGAAMAAGAPGELTLRASLGTMYRIPTFTELFYWDPRNHGNPGLVPESGWAWDAGIDLQAGAWTLLASYFERHEDDLIDWVATAVDPARIWYALNIASGRARGTELAATWAAPRGHSIALRHTYLDRRTSLPGGYLAKYAQVLPRHLLGIEGTVVLPGHLRATLAARYRAGRGSDPVLPASDRDPFIIDARVRWAPAATLLAVPVAARVTDAVTSPQAAALAVPQAVPRVVPPARTWLTGWSIAVQATNLADRAYEEVPGVPMPGRLVAATLAWEF